MLSLNYTLCAVKDRTHLPNCQHTFSPFLKKILKTRTIPVPLFGIEQGSDMTDEHHTAQPFV